MNRNSILNSLPGSFRVGLATAMLCLGGQAHATIDGWTGVPDSTNPTVKSYELTARQDFISTSDGNSHYSWGYAHGSANYPMQYPGPTLIVNQGDTVKIKLNNTLPVPVSIVFPGQQNVSADLCNLCQSGVLTREVRALTPLEVSQNAQLAGPTYTFVASQPGTYLYHSGTNPDLQREMGLVGALIVRPTNYDVGTAGAHPGRKAYENAGTNYDRENLFLLTEMDPAIHWQVYGQVSSGRPVAVDTTTIRPSMWFINGRNATDTLLEDYVYWLPTQPYNALPRMHPGERLLMRVVNGGRDLHPFHHHGNHATPIARDGRVLSSDPANLAKAPDITSPDFTVRSVPGQTMDLIYEWTGKGIGWDVYGHALGDPLEPNESAADHGKPIPVIIPSQLDISSGESYSGSPFLGSTGSLPQGHPGLNTTGGYYHMWHSHNEKEITTDDIFPGGMMTMLIVEPWSVDLDAGDTSTPPPPPPPPVAVCASADVIFCDGFESGTFAAWGTGNGQGPSTNTASRLSVTTGAAALLGTNGMQAQGNNTNYVQHNLGSSEGIFDARFYFNPNGFTPNAGGGSNNQDIFVARTTTGGTTVFRVRYRMNSAQSQVQIQIGASTSNTSWTALTNSASNRIEVVWQAAGSTGPNPGTLVLYVNGVSSQSLTTTSTNSVGQVRLGSVTDAGGNTNTTLEYFDGFASKRTASPLIEDRQ